MSFRSLLVQRCTVVHYGQVGTDTRNTPVMGETGRTENVPCRIQQLTTTEVLIQRDNVSATHRGFFLPDLQIGQFDTVEIDEDLVYRVAGRPDLVYGRTTPHHWEVLLETVSDLDWAYP